VYLLPIGDTHFGSINSEIEKVKGFINWAKKEKAYIFLMGDIFDVATIDSKTSPFQQSMTLNEAIELACEIFEPVKEQIIGGIVGNHEIRLTKYAGFDIMQNFCKILDIKYCGYSAVIRFRTGHINRKSGLISPRVEYIFYAHHTTGGGNTVGGKLNRIEKLRQIFEGADCYLGGHNHFEGMGKIVVAYLSKSGNGRGRINYRKIYFVDTGSFLGYDGSYAEERMLMPATTGCPRIRMNGHQKDLHVSQ